VYSIYSSKVIKGQGLASKFLLPTLNLDVNCLSNDLKYGVYSCYVLLNGKRFLSMMHYGPRSTDSQVSLEIHVIDVVLSSDIRWIFFQPVFFIRDVQHFESLHDLKKQLGLDLINVLNHD